MKRGQSGLSCVVGVDKPAGMSSHDVVNACRGIFGERRVGHTGTLDPLATGVLPICIGPATRLSSYLTSDSKTYEVRMIFGASTDTDDADGEVLRCAEVPTKLSDSSYAQAMLDSLKGTSMQLPPIYSAVKVNGQKSYDAARKGTIINLQPREIEVFEARLVRIVSSEAITQAKSPYCTLAWDVEFHVSKGTYIRSLVRDLGNHLGCFAYVDQLRRLVCGNVLIDDCISLETLRDIKDRAALDPVRLLDFRIIFCDSDRLQLVKNGGKLSARSEIHEFRRGVLASSLCACTSGIQKSCASPEPGESFSVVGLNKLFAIYEYDGQVQCFKPQCVFQEGISRGSDL